MAKGDLGYSSDRDLSEDIRVILAENNGSMWLSDMAEDMGEAVPDLQRNIKQMDDVMLHRGRVLECPE